jgi:sugar diacid utilization regulator
LRSTDTPAAYVPPPCLRYRLQKLRQLAGGDLDNPDRRLALMLQLRLLDIARPLDG